MKRNNLLCTFAVIMAVCSCAGEKTVDPYKEALSEALQKQSTEQFNSISFSTFERIDSSTFRDEFDRRRNVFAVKVAHDSTQYQKFLAEKKTRNAEIQRQNILRDQAVIVRLDSLAGTLDGKMDDIAFYDYHFSVYAKGKSTIMKLDDAYASITPEYEVVGLTTKKRDIHKATGKAIPGYLDTIKEEETE